MYTNFLGSFILMFFLHIFIQRRSEELACASREQADSANGVGNNAPSGSRGSGMPLFGLNTEERPSDENSFLWGYDLRTFMWCLHRVKMNGRLPRCPEAAAVLV